MKFSTRDLLQASILLVALVLGSQSSYAQNATQFFCGASVTNGVLIPTTLARTPRGDVPVIRWVSTYFSVSGYDPQTRCEQVSARFQLYHQRGSLQYLTTGRMNTMPVICTTTAQGGSCQNLLFTLKPTSSRSPSETLQALMDVRQRSGSALNETTGRLYIDMQEYLATAPIQMETDRVQLIEDALW